MDPPIAPHPLVVALSPDHSESVPPLRSSEMSAVLVPAHLRAARHHAGALLESSTPHPVAARWQPGGSRVVAPGRTLDRDKKWGSTPSRISASRGGEAHGVLTARTRRGTGHQFESRADGADEEMQRGSTYISSSHGAKEGLGAPTAQ
jgi:hypothetical protein